MAWVQARNIHRKDRLHVLVHHDRIELCRGSGEGPPIVHRHWHLALATRVLAADHLGWLDEAEPIHRHQAHLDVVRCLSWQLAVWVARVLHVRALVKLAEALLLPAIAHLIGLLLLLILAVGTVWVVARHLLLYFLVLFFLHDFLP